MPDRRAPLKLGADCWNQFTDWPSLLAVMQRAEALGYESLWLPDHVYPPLGTHDGAILEPYMALAPIAAATSRATVGLMVGANTYRNPALMTKMVTTLDHISGGRAILGIGAAWSEVEHTGYGFEFGAGPPERLRWLREALPVIRGMLDGQRPSSAGPHYRMEEVVNEPPPVQSHLPILIGGSGPRVTLRLVAEYADMCNIGGPPERVAERDAILREHCATVGRDEATIERSIDVGVPVIRDDRSEAERVGAAIHEHNGGEGRWPTGLSGTPEDLIESLLPYIELGYHHIVFYFPAPFDAETMTRITSDVRPALEAAIAA